MLMQDVILKQQNPYELGVVTAWAGGLHPEIVELARSGASDLSEFERGLADGNNGIGIIRHATHVEFRQTGQRPVKLEKTL